MDSVFQHYDLQHLHLFVGTPGQQLLAELANADNHRTGSCVLSPGQYLMESLVTHTVLCSGRALQVSQREHHRHLESKDNSNGPVTIPDVHTAAIAS